MRILLDTHVLIWSFYRSSRLRAPVRAQIEDPANAIFFSAASLWEIAIKAALERPDFDVDPDRLLEEAIKAGSLNSRSRHAWRSPFGTCRSITPTRSTVCSSPRPWPNPAFS